MIFLDNKFQTFIQFLKQHLLHRLILLRRMEQEIQILLNFQVNLIKKQKIKPYEYYDLVYEYKNDCLTAGIKYRKTYYQDRDLKPGEDLMFTLTIYPITTIEQKVDKSLYRN